MHEDVEFTIGTVILRGRLFLPDGVEGPLPLVIGHSGIGSVAEGIFDLAPSFTDNGLAVLFYDHRNFGYSDGEPRQQVDPWQFGRDLRDVIDRLALREDIDGRRIALWGISLGGMIALFVAGTDRRPAAVVSVVPPISGWSARRLFDPSELAGVDASVYSDRTAQASGTPALTLTGVGVRTPDGPPVMFTDPDGIEFVSFYNDLPSFRNELTVSSVDRIFEMELTVFAPRIAAPVLMVVASEDTVAPVADALEMFDLLPGQKELITYPGQHYGILLRHYREITARSAVWLAQTLA